MSESVILMIKPTVNLFELLDWCAKYQRHDMYPQDVLTRFNIGLYQYHQGIDWKNSASSGESYMSCVIHWLMIASRLRLPVEDYISYKLTDSEVRINTEEFVYSVSASTQQLFYMKNCDLSNYQRKSRVKIPRLTEHLSVCINHCIGKVPVRFMTGSVEIAMRIMCGKL